MMIAWLHDCNFPNTNFYIRKKYTCMCILYSRLVYTYFFIVHSTTVGHFRGDIVQGSHIHRVGGDLSAALLSEKRNASKKTYKYTPLSANLKKDYE